MNPAIIALLIPIVAILSGVYLANQKIKSKNGGLSAADKDLLGQLKASYSENEKLSERVKNLEYIVTSLDKDILKLHAPELNTDAPSRQIEELKAEIKRLKG